MVSDRRQKTYICYLCVYRVIKISFDGLGLLFTSPLLEHDAPFFEFTLS